MAENQPEFWLRGPLENIPALLQPAAHALLQANAEIQNLLIDFPPQKLWLKPAGVASAAFHLQHITGVLDRLFTYSKNEQLSPQQLLYLKNEGIENNLSADELLLALNNQIKASLNYLKTINTTTLTEVRLVGRKNLPSTVIGLIFHAAEHTMRHTGQLLVTIKTLEQSN